MLTTLFESTCVTSAVVRDSLIICTPPYIRVYDQYAQPLFQNNLAAKIIYDLDFAIVVLTLDNKLLRLDGDLGPIATYPLPAAPLAIFNNKTHLLLEYQYEYQLYESQGLQPLQKKNEIHTFAASPLGHFTYILQKPPLQNNQVQFGPHSVAIEIGVDALFPLSATQPIYVYRSKILPQITILDLAKGLELHHLDFMGQLDNVFYAGQRVFLQSGIETFELIMDHAPQLRALQFRKQLSCVVPFGKLLFFGSIHDNSVLCSEKHVVKEFVNLGQIIDIYPYQKSCLVASAHKLHPVSLFRSGINEQLIAKHKLQNEPPRSVHFINGKLILLSFAQHSEIMTLPTFKVVHIGLITNQRTLLIKELAEGQLLQVTQLNILIIQNYAVVRSYNFESRIIQALIESNKVAIYSDKKIIIYEFLNNSLVHNNTYQVSNLSALAIIEGSIYYAKWFSQQLFKNANESYHIEQIKSSIISIASTKAQIFLGMNDGLLIILNKNNLRFSKLLQISNNHPVLLTQLKSDKLLIRSNHSHTINDSLDLTTVNWDHIFDVSVYGEELVGIINGEIQYVKLSRESSSQCHELKFIQNKIVHGVRFFKDHMILLVLKEDSHHLESYYDEQLKYFIDLKMECYKLDVLNNIVVVGTSKCSNKGQIEFYSENLTQLSTNVVNEPVYDIRMNEAGEIYYSTNTCIINLQNTFFYDFKLPILGFDIKDNYFLIYEQIKGAHLYYYDEKMIALGSLLMPCQYAAFYYEDIIAFSESEMKIAKPNPLTLGINEQMEVICSKPINISCIKNFNYATQWGDLGLYE